MNPLHIATAQFENQSGNKEYNLSRIADLSKQAAAQGAQVIAFHECSITGYSFARNLSFVDLLSVAENLSNSDSIHRLQEIASENSITILAGLFEKDNANRIYNTYVCVDGNGLLASYRKLHPFISAHLSAGSEYCVFNLYGWKCGILICYDNNIIENVRATVLLGAQVIVMPHVTMCTPSTRPGAGFVDHTYWLNRERDSTSLRFEFYGPKGRQWLLKWLPARAYDNAVYVVFSNPIGMDDDQLKNGCSMLLDPFGDILEECSSMEDEFVLATFHPEKLELAGGYRYRNARKPELYAEILAAPHQSDQQISWLSERHNKVPR